MEHTLKRSSGVLLHISSLPGKYGCGSFGKEALDFVDILARCGFSYWQTLPFCLPDEHGSPYKSASAFSTNPYFIDLPTLFADGLITEDELKGAEQKNPYLLELEGFEKRRMPLLAKAAGRADGALREKINSYAESEPKIKEYCAWAADNLPDYDSSDTEFFRRFCEYEFFTQWTKIKEYANARGIRIIGDIPIYLDLESCDVQLHPELFMLDGKGRPLAVAGCPPDEFSAEGQLWGNPIYDWTAMAREGFGWWRERVDFCFRFFDVLRIDHFRAVEAYWSIPANAETAAEGKWEKGPGMPFVQALRTSASGDIIAEDLGVSTPGLEAFMKECGLPSMRIMQFGEYSGDAYDPHMTYNFPANCVAYTGTHDNNTLLGWAYELSAEKRRRLFDYCSYSGENINEGCAAVIRTLFTSPASVAILPFQDLLLYGKDTRMNTPGVKNGNWTYRATYDAVSKINIEHFSWLNSISARAPKIHSL
ncbi:MAG: 4-alpha-glucanotransferase [Clostridia bacterium]|nr:4-alpha-glucanotransferase [Clostridia bacterium]